MASNLLAMASNLLAMTSNLPAMASNLLAMTSNLPAMAFGLSSRNTRMSPGYQTEMETGKATRCTLASSCERFISCIRP